MRKLFWKSLLVSPAILGATLAVSSAKAVEAPFKTEAVQPEAAIELAQVQDDQLINQVETYSNEGQLNTSDQVTSVSELRDVEPTEWAYEALRSLVERYGCIVGYPDRTFRGNRALSRWEFAAGLNACMNVMERLIQENVAVLREDIDKLKRLMEEFAAELAALGARVDNLEGRVAFLEDHQFSTTTKLAGEVIFAVTNDFGGNSNNQTAFQDRVRLNLNTSFTGNDRLVTRLAAGNSNSFNSLGTLDFDNPLTGDPESVQFNTNSATGLQTWQNTQTDNGVKVDWLAYYAPVSLGENFKLDTYVAAFGGLFDDFVPTLNPYFEDFDGGSGSLSTFAQRNPIYRIGGGSGAGFSLKLGFLEQILGPTSLSVGYLAGGNPNNGQSAGDPSESAGLFNGDYGLLAQINGNLFDFVNFGLTYSNGYLNAGSPLYGSGSDVALVGTGAANGVGDAFFTGGGADFLGSRRSVNSYGAQIAFNLFGVASFSAFGSYTNVNYLGNPGLLAASNGEFAGLRGDVDVWTYGGGFAFPDLGKEGNLLGIFAGVQPYLGNIPGNAAGSGLVPDQFFSNENPIHVEIFYKYQVTDNISVTPGFIYISNPEQFGEFDDSFIGTIRGTFTF